MIEGRRCLSFWGVVFFSSGSSWKTQNTRIATGDSKHAVETCGERFADGSAIELVVGDKEDILQLVF